MYRQFVIPVKRKKENKNTLKYEDVFRYKCLYCSVEYDLKEKAKECVDKHDLVLVPIARNDLGRLNQFFYLKEDKLLTESLIRIVQKYVRNQV